MARAFAAADNSSMLSTAMMPACLKAPKLTP
jgi:hypothetical protein